NPAAPWARRRPCGGANLSSLPSPASTGAPAFAAPCSPTAGRWAGRRTAAARSRCVTGTRAGSSPPVFTCPPWTAGLPPDSPPCPLRQHAVRVRLQSADPVQMIVDVERRELDRPVEAGVAAERAADVEADHERRPRSLGLFRRRARHRAQPQDQCGDATPHDAPPSTVWVLPVAKIGVLWSTWSSDRNGRLKCGLPMITTTKKLNPLAT